MRGRASILGPPMPGRRRTARLDYLDVERNACARGHPGETPPVGAAATLAACPSPSKTSTPSSPPAASAAGCGRCPVPTRPKFLHDLTGSGHTLLRDTWDRLEPLVGPRPHRGRHRPRAPRGGREGAARHPRQERLPRVRAARLGGGDRARRGDPVAGASPTSSSAPSPPTMSSAAPQVFDWAVQQAVAVAREGYICTIGIPPTEPSVGFGYIQKGGELVVDGRARGGAGRALRREARPRHRQASTSPTARTCGTPGMFIARADVLLGEIAENQPHLLCGTDGARRGVGRPRRARPRRRPGLADDHEDRDRLRRRRAGRRARAASPSSPGTSTGTTWGTSRASRSSTRTGARTTSRSSARTRGSSPMRPAASSSARPSGSSA